MSGVQGVEKIDRTLSNGKAVGELSFFFGMRHLGNCHPRPRSIAPFSVE